MNGNADFARFPLLGLLDKARLAAAVVYASRFADPWPLYRITAQEWLTRWCGRRGLRGLLAAAPAGQVRPVPRPGGRGVHLGHPHAPLRGPLLRHPGGVDGLRPGRLPDHPGGPSRRPWRRAARCSASAPPCRARGRSREAVSSFTRAGALGTTRSSSPGPPGWRARSPAPSSSLTWSGRSARTRPRAPTSAWSAWSWPCGASSCLITS